MTIVTANQINSYKKTAFGVEGGEATQNQAMNHVEVLSQYSFHSKLRWKVCDLVNNFTHQKIAQLSNLAKRLQHCSFFSLVIDDQTIVARDCEHSIAVSAVS